MHAIFLDFNVKTKSKYSRFFEQNAQIDLIYYTCIYSVFYIKANEL